MAPPRRSRPGEMSDEQRKAMFASMGRGGGGGGGGSVGSGGGGGSAQGPARMTQAQAAAEARARIAARTNEYFAATAPRPTAQGYTPTGPKWREVLKEGAKGFGQGLWAGVLNVADAFTFRQIDALGRAVADRSWMPGMQTSQHAATVARESLLTAAGIGLFTRAVAAYRGTALAQTTIGQHAGLLTAVGGFSSQAGIEAYRASDPTRHYAADKALGMASQLAGLVGGMGAFSSVVRYGGALMRALPAGARLDPAAIARLEASPFMRSLRDNKVASNVKDLLTRGSVTPNPHLPNYPGGGRLSLLSQVQRATFTVGDAVGRAATAAGRAVVPEAARPAVKSLLAMQRAAAQFTGATLRELTRIPANLKALQRSKTVLQQGQRAGVRAADAAQKAQQARVQAARHGAEAKYHTDHAMAMRTQARTDAPWLKDVAYRDLKLSHQMSQQGRRRAGDVYQEGRRTFYDIERASTATENNVVNMFRRASQDAQRATSATLRADRYGALSQKLTQQALDAPRIAAQMAHDAKVGLAKAGLVTAGMIGTHLYDERGIRGHQQQAAQHFQRGDNYPLPQDTPRRVLGTLAAAATGWTLNNPGEKQIRPGRARWQAEQGAARAVRDLADRQLAEGRIDRATWEQVVSNIRTPWAHESGRELWTVAPATAIMANWKIGDLLDRAARTHNVRVESVYDADTATFQDPRTGERYQFPGQGPGQTVRGAPSDQSGVVRFLGYDAPELARTWGPVEDHRPAEWGGPESTQRAKELLPEGSLARVIQDSNPRASGLGIYGRQLGTVESMRWYNQIPYLGAVLPGRDVGEQLIREGFGDVGVHRHLSGRTDTEARYHRAMQEAIAAQRGIFSPEGQLHHPRAGQQPSPEERSDAHYRRMTGENRPETLYGRALTPAAVGLMTTGNTGIFRTLGRAGPGTGQVYNLIVAALGALEYNERASRTAPREYYLPRGLATDYQSTVDTIRADLW